VNDNITVAEGFLTSGDVLANDTELDDTPVNVTLGTGPTHGTLTLNTDGTYTYTHDGSENFTDSFTYTITDNDGQSDTATVNINITPVSDTTPDAINDTLTLAEGASTSGDVLANDTGLADTPANVTLSTGPTHGTLTLNTDGTYTYTHDGSENFTDSFTYAITDNDGESDTAAVDINITPVSDTTPDAINDTVTLTEGASTSGDVLTNDNGLVDTPIDVVLGTGPSHGTLTLNNNGTFTYIHDGTENFTDSFTYIITDNDGQTDTATVHAVVTPENDPPEAQDDALVATEDTPLLFDVSDLFANDVDVDGDALTLDGFSQPLNGTLVDNGNGTLTYLPDANYHGPDSFTYGIRDGNGGRDVATVIIDVLPINDPPTAVDDHDSLNEDQSLIIDAADLLANDTDPDLDSLVIDSFTSPLHGTLVDNGNGTLTYTPFANYNGADSFTYTVRDPSGEIATATVDLDVLPTNDPPVGGGDNGVHDEDTNWTTTISKLLANDSDIDGDALTLIDLNQPQHGTVVINPDSTVTYTPDMDYSGPDSFSYTIADPSGATDTVTVQLTVLPVNDPPVASGDFAQTTFDHPVDIDVLQNDIDVDGEPLQVISATDPWNGSVVINGDGTVTYQANDEYVGTDVFTYTIRDAQGVTSTATVEVVVTEPLFYAFDSFNDFTDDQPLGSGAPDNTRPEDLLNTIPADMVFSGIAQPGASMDVNVYDDDGDLIGRRHVVADVAGNWLVSIPRGDAASGQDTRVEIVGLAAHHAFQYLGGFNSGFRQPCISVDSLTVDSVMALVPHTSLELMHHANLHPLTLGWAINGDSVNNADLVNGPI